jgi:hypothetical protein
LTTFTVSVSGVPLRFSLMSLRNMSVRDGYGPAVSLGVTAHVAFVLVVGVVPDDVSTAVGLVCESPQAAATAAAAAPMAPNAARRLSCLAIACCCSATDIPPLSAGNVTVTSTCWETLSAL